MKKKIYLIATILVAVVMFSGCKKDSDNTTAAATTAVTPPPTPTSLTITFTDNVGSFAQGVSVYLYSSLADLTNRTNQVGTTAISDANGKVTFSSGMASIKYYWWAEKGCLNNNTGISTTAALTANTSNTVSVALASTGTLQLINTSSNPYYVYFNGTYAFTMGGSTSQNVNYVPTGSRIVRVLQVSGYVLYPTDESFSVNITCGSTTTQIFP